MTQAVHMGAASPSVQIELIGPAQGGTLLQHNQGNRKVRETRVVQYRDAMIAGDWVLTGDAVCISPEGRLLNAQHRLHAVMLSGKTFPFVVLRDLPEESYHAMDAGTLRTSGDLFRSHQIANPNECAAIARLLVVWESGTKPGSPTLRTGKKQGRAVTTIEAERAYIAYKDEITKAVRIGCNLRGLYPAARIGFVDVMLRLVHGERASEFWALVDPKQRKGLDAGHPCRTLREHMQRPEARAMRTPEFCAKAIRAFNAWIEGEQLERLTYNPAEEFPVISSSVLAQLAPDPEPSPQPVRTPEIAANVDLGPKKPRGAVVTGFENLPTAAPPPEAVQQPESRDLIVHPKHPRDLNPEQVASAFYAIADAADYKTLQREHYLDRAGIDWMLEHYSVDFQAYAKLKAPFQRLEFRQEFLKRLKGSKA